MRKLFFLVPLLLLFSGCEKSNGDFSTIYAEVETKSGGDNGQRDMVILELFIVDPWFHTAAGLDGSNSPGKSKTPEYSLPKGSNLTYNLQVLQWIDDKAWSDMTVKIFVGNKVKFSKKIKKGETNVSAYGNIIID
jgi:hypothetical protein